MPLVVQPFYSIQYDGTNGSYIAGTWCTGITFVSDTGTVFTYHMYDGNRTVNIGEWVVIDVVSCIEPSVFTPGDYAARYVELFEKPVITLAAGYALTPNISASASANVAVDLDTTMSGTTYQASAVLAGSASLLGDLDITAVAITDSNTVTVTVQNNGVIALAGATVIVTAAELT